MLLKPYYSFRKCWPSLFSDLESLQGPFCQIVAVFSRLKNGSGFNASHTVRADRVGMLIRWITEFHLWVLLVSETVTIFTDRCFRLVEPSKIREGRERRVGCYNRNYTVITARQKACYVLRNQHHVRSCCRVHDYILLCSASALWLSPDPDQYNTRPTATWRQLQERHRAVRFHQEQLWVAHEMFPLFWIISLASNRTRRYFCGHTFDGDFILI